MPPVRPLPPPGPSQRRPSGMRGGNSGRRPNRSKYKDLKLKLIIILGLNGYDGDGEEPPSLGGDNACPHCLLTPCIIEKPPSWLRGSAGPCLANASKRYKLYHKFWSLLAKLGVWDEPIYVALKETFTSSNDRREVMPVCILDVSYLLIISLTNNLCVLGGERAVPKSTRRPIHQLSAILKMKK